MSPRRCAAAALLLALSACAPMPAGTAGAARAVPGAAFPTDDAPFSGPAAIEHLVTIVNRHRATKGCPALEWMPEAARVAQAHSDDMARRNYFSHISPEGRAPMGRLQAAGIRYRRMGENIAQTPGGPDDALGLWLTSPGHREILEDCEYTHHGIGERDGRWTHVFVTPWSEP
ncbi:CAP domain-containing protein [Longimicrobium terrae]|uniref:Uncharacterized protein YkwD n=1 Tax=Longimicrobium terrae TaxID=1639882 RepID=A0A841H789_9BACT|nr:CAP domain-containing protein [Longimicrobium terrae]MBB4639370.1 uncharacterized protein YkwD [Longimicrobium terrae]MBB6073559.1 uncharacterized protein YkwD [Longimicrobium terrae]NNC29432.1 CAP domain-containing protein [Longimicrobium terrae]